MASENVGRKRRHDLFSVFYSITSVAVPLSDYAPMPTLISLLYRPSFWDEIWIAYYDLTWPEQDYRNSDLIGSHITVAACWWLGWAWTCLLRKAANEVPTYAEGHFRRRIVDVRSDSNQTLIGPWMPGCYGLKNVGRMSLFRGKERRGLQADHQKIINVLKWWRTS
jgi:hypothetical protein